MFISIDVLRNSLQKYRVLASLQAWEKKFRVPVLARIQLLIVLAIVKRLDLFKILGVQKVLKSKQKLYRYNDPDIFVECILYNNPISCC